MEDWSTQEQRGPFPTTSRARSYVSKEVTLLLKNFSHLLKDGLRRTSIV